MTTTQFRSELARSAFFAASMMGVMMTSGMGFAQPAFYVSPDVPTTPDGPPTYRPWDIVEHGSGGPLYALELTVPGDPAIDALHKMDQPNNWLISPQAPNDLGGAGFTAQPEDIVRLDAGTASMFFDGSCIPNPIPAGSNTDAATLVSGDDGNLWLSFDVPTTLGATTYKPSEVLEFDHVGAGPCDWSFVSSIDLQAASAVYFPSGTNVTGLDRLGSDLLLVAIDVPLDAAPTVGPTTYLPGQVAAFDVGTGSWSLFEDLLTEGAPGWPISSLVDGLSCEANPGRIDTSMTQIELSKNGAQIDISCPGSCSSGGRQYGLYEGTLASVRTGVYDHARVSCAETCPGNVVFTPAATDGYFLLVPNNEKEEGSYGLDFVGGVKNERPPAAALPDRCTEIQIVTACP